MTLIYIIIAYVAGVATSLFVIFVEAYAKSFEKSEPPTIEKNEEEEIQPAIQFVEAEPLVDRLKDGTTLNEIIR